MFKSITALTLMFIPLVLLPAPIAQSAPGCFPEVAPAISACVDGRIGEFWARNGGLPVFGYPTGAQQAQSVEGRALQAQAFERNRLELHPENAAPHDVGLGRIGAELLAQQGRIGTPSRRPIPARRIFLAKLATRSRRNSGRIGRVTAWNWTVSAADLSRKVWPCSAYRSPRRRLRPTQPTASHT